MTSLNTERVIVYAGSLLRERREQAGMSPEDLGRAVDVTGETIREWESGRYKPNASKLARLATVLGCVVDDFFMTRTVSTE